MMTTTDALWWTNDEELALHQQDESYIDERTRRFCYRRDQYKCRKCGAEEGLTLHHVVYRSQLGGHDPENLVTLCWSCHRRVHDKEIVPRRINGVWIFVDKKSWRYQQYLKRRRGRR